MEIQKESCQKLEFVGVEGRPSFQVNVSGSGSRGAFPGGQVSATKKNEKDEWAPKWKSIESQWPQPVTLDHPRRSKSLKEKTPVWTTPLRRPLEGRTKSGEGHQETSDKRDWSLFKQERSESLAEVSSYPFKSS